MIALSPSMLFSFGLLAAGFAAILGFFVIEFLTNRKPHHPRLPPAE